MTPEQRARANIDNLLEQAGWVVQDAGAVNLYASDGVAVREFSLKPGHGAADYLLHVNQKAAGIIEAKPEGSTLTGVEVQSEKYSTGLPDNLPALRLPLPFLYESTGAETQFTNRLDPEPRSRLVFSFHAPETLAAWAGTSETPGTDTRRIAEEGRDYPEAYNLRQRLKAMPPLNPSGLWTVQERAINHLEESLAAGRPRALVQMATGSGKTFMACNLVYRLIKHAGARRVLFLVDRSNLGRQTLREFQGFTTPDEGRKFTELYNVQLLQGGRIDPVSRVCISTIQRGLFDSEGRRPSPGVRRAIRLRHSHAQAPARARRVQPRRSHRDLRRDHHRRVPPLDLQPVAAGTGVLRRLPHRADRHTLQADLRVLPAEPGHGVQPRAGGG